jgi:hypothetical protein
LDLPSLFETNELMGKNITDSASSALSLYPYSKFEISTSNLIGYGMFAILFHHSTPVKQFENW